MSGFNRFIQENIGTLNVSQELGITSKMTLGTLEGVPVQTTTYNTGDGETIITWDEGITGCGALTDLAAVVLYDVAGGNLQLFVGAETRDDESITVTFTTGLTATEVIAYLFFYRGTAGTFIVSDSVADVCAAP